MDYKTVILDFFYTGYGVIAHPKSDGRVEVPRQFVKLMGWDKCKTLYMSYEDGAEFYISNDSKFHCDDPVQIEVAVSDKRIRVPAGFLRKIGMCDKDLSFTAGDGLGIVKADNSHNRFAIEAFISSLMPRDIKELGMLLSGEGSNEMISYVEAKIPFGEVARIPVKRRPRLILLRKIGSTVFRPIGNPYKFEGYWSGREIVFSRGDSEVTPETLYLVPGIQRVKQEEGGFIFGFLLLDEKMVGKIRDRIVHKNSSNTAVDVEMIFIYDGFTFGSFKIYTNPPDELPEDVLNKARETCSDPEKFLLSTFRVVDSPPKDSPPESVNSRTVELCGTQD